MVLVVDVGIGIGIGVGVGVFLLDGKKQGCWLSLGFLLGKDVFQTNSHATASEFHVFFPVNTSLAFLVAFFVVGVLYCTRDNIRKPRSFSDTVRVVMLYEVTS